MLKAHTGYINHALFTGEEPTNEQSYRYLTNDEPFKMPDDSMHPDMDTTEKKTSTLSRPGDDTHSNFGDTIERKLMHLETQKDRPDGRNYDAASYTTDNIALSAPPVNAG